LPILGNFYHEPKIMNALQTSGNKRLNKRETKQRERTQVELEGQNPKWATSGQMNKSCAKALVSCMNHIISPTIRMSHGRNLTVMKNATNA
jgi:hypothetical protein